MFTFAWPLAFLLLPLFWLMQKYRQKNISKNDVLLRVPFLTQVDAFNQDTAAVSMGLNSRKKFLAFSIWLLFILALANPRWLGEPTPITQSGHNIMLAVDLSPSMEIPDFTENQQTKNRLETVKEVAINFIKKRRGDKLGLILFGSKAYLQTPLTIDRLTVSNMLVDATIGLAGGRTAIGDAIALAIKKFVNEDVKSRILILLTDGGNNSGSIDPKEAAALAKDNQIKIYTVGIGASQMLISGMFGPQVINPSVDLDEELLKKIATITNGQYFRAQDKQTLAEILNAIDKLEPIEMSAKTLRPMTSLFYWPLTAALILLLIFIYPNFRVKSRI